MKIAITITILLAAYAAVSTMSYNDAVDQHEFNCAMIDAGAWPATVEDCK